MGQRYIFHVKKILQNVYFSSFGPFFSYPKGKNRQAQLIIRPKGVIAHLLFTAYHALYEHSSRPTNRIYPAQPLDLSALC